MKAAHQAEQLAKLVNDIKLSSDQASSSTLPKDPAGLTAEDDEADRWDEGKTLDRGI